MKLSERIISSPLLYPLWRVAWLERAFFQTCRIFNSAEQAAFNFYNFGFDVSKWQGAIDFAKMLIYGAKFLILRCAYGIKQDERFAEYMPEAVVRFSVSAYAYYDPIYSPEAQAAKVIEVLAPYKDRIRRVWLDLEFYWSGSYSSPQHWKTFRDRINAAGYKTGWYTRATWWDSRVGSFASEFARDPVWAAQYNNALTLIPKGWTKVMLWQNDTPAIGHAAGAESAEIDNDIWNDEFSFYDEWSAVLPPVDPPPTDPEPPTGGTTVTTYYLTATGDPTKVFADANGTSPIAQIKKGVSFTSRARTASTYYITSPQVGYVKFTQVHLDKTVEDTPPVEPPPVEPPPTTVSPVIFASMDFDLQAKTMTTTRRRADGTSQVENDTIA